MTKRAKVLGELERERHSPVSVRDEIRSNLLERLRRGDGLFPGVVGYDETVLPQIVNALLARHDIILLGLRGQAKTRLCRLLCDFLDDEIPVIAGSPLREHPLAPVLESSCDLVREAGDDLPIEWVERGDRYGEKLATPDVTMADLIGDIDPLKASHRKLDLCDPEVIHFGIVPRTNHGVFTINELPDLAPRIQVGLLNILEERDLQIRGFPLRIPLDVVMVFTANPEDYTNRGSIITPLKDRIASQILTHYPRTLEEARRITDGESWIERSGGAEVDVPGFLLDVIEAIGLQGRQSEYVDQTSGVSVRLSIAARELLVSQVERRAACDGGGSGTARLIDLAQVLPGITGKVELVYEGEQEGATKVARHLIGAASRQVFDRHFPDVIKEGSEIREERGTEPRISNDRYKPILDWFSGGKRLDISDGMGDREYEKTLDSVPGLGAVVDEFLSDESGAARATGAEQGRRAAAMELVLEGLHQHSLLAKEEVVSGASYSDMLGIMLEDLQ